MTHLYSDETELMNDVIVLQRFIGEQKLYHEGCPLLRRQLTELEVFLEKAQGKVRELQAKLNDRGALK